ncbi:c-type cytochrome [Marinobacterium stanieri]|uniref:Cytochrome c556 n=1 Tax=Marinobacterium stanieri TaxID=49186 RepID=A0A1N6TV45_9GAMM|nr:cytochrome c [Marinobacterium stanieri]SIQ57213.1 Cytochrome c556 [Marinobacterium stanieri]
MKKIAAMGLAGALAMASTVAVAVKPEDAIDYRQGVFQAIKWHFGTMGAMVKGKMDYDADDFTRRAEIVSQLSHLPWEGFVEGSYSGDTDALPAIADNWDKFEGGSNMLMEKTAALATAAKTGDMDQIRPAFGEVGKTCKGCHDNFKD